MTPIRFEDGRLMVEDMPAGDLAARFGTPLYVTSEAQLRANAPGMDRRPRRRLAARPQPGAGVAQGQPQPGPAGGAERRGRRLRRVRRRRARDRARRRRRSRADLGERLHQAAALLERAVAAGARVTVDSVEELAEAAAVARELGTAAVVRVRLRPDLTDVAITSEFTEAAPLGEVADAYKPGIPIERAAGGAARDRSGPASS